LTSLLFSLHKKGKILKNDEEYYEKIIKLLQDIRGDLDGKIRKNKLEEFLKIDESLTNKRISFKESIINRRLNLIKLILEGFNPEKEYNELKRKFDKINEDITKLKFIKDNIIIYFNETYQDILERLIEVINNSQNKEIKQYKEGRIKTCLDDC